jgi:hypothetical protein
VRGLAAAHPERWPRIGSDARRIVFRAFPYSLIYMVSDDHILVLAIKHHSRHPDCWRGGR